MKKGKRNEGAREKIEKEVNEGNDITFYRHSNLQGHKIINVSIVTTPQFCR
jgi:predicted RNA-binding protein with PUA-like domain